MGPTRTFLDGIGGWFHADCPPEVVGYANSSAPGLIRVEAHFAPRCDFPNETTALVEGR